MRRSQSSHRLPSLHCGVMFGVLALLWTAPVVLAAQDARTVHEPVVPRACVTLDAQLELRGDSTVAPDDERRVDSPRLQAAIDGCPAGRAVVLRADGPRRAFVSGPLQLRRGVTLVLGPGTVLLGSRDARLFDVTPGACGVLRTAGGRGCRALINAEGADSSGVMGPGTIDGRGWATPLGRDETWWEMAEQARDTKFSQNNFRLIVAVRSHSFTLYNLTLRNSPNFHVVVERTDGFTAWGVTINTPKGARNTDGIDPSGSVNVSILHSHIHTGDDNIAIKAGNAGAARRITVAHSHFYSGHGVSLGSETDGGAGEILVHDVTFQGTDNALRIKSNGSRGGVVDGVQYENVCIRDVRYPVYMDSHYSASPELDGNRIPQYRNVLVRDVRILGKGTVVLDGYDQARPLGITFDGLMADTPDAIRVRGGRTTLTIGPRGTNLRIPDSVATVTRESGTAAPNPELARCADRLHPFPGGAATPITVRKLAKPTATSSVPAVRAPPTDTARYRNPVLFADFSDPDVIRDGEDFWMTASSFGHVPGLPILHSRDLVHWTIVNHAIPRFADAAFERPQHGNGVWAPSLRKHDGWFWIYYGDPDRGIYMTRTRNPRSAWSPPVLVQAGRGLIDPSPLWLPDGTAWLVHAYARSRAGIKHRLVVHAMRPDGRALLDTGVVVYEDSLRHPTIEGPKFHQHAGETWILAPAGGVATGWQVALRAPHPRGPYIARTVLAQGDSPINGPHQGAWVSLVSGEHWFLHFQDRGPYGRIVHLQPMRWREDGWPVIGEATPSDTIGRPVHSAPRPRVAATSTRATLQTSDEFRSGRPGAQWQWQANPRQVWYRAAGPGVLGLVAQPLGGAARNLWDAPHLLMQKLSAEAMTVTTTLEPRGGGSGDRGGLIIFGLDYAWIGVQWRDGQWELVESRVRDADRGTMEAPVVLTTLQQPRVRVRVRVTEGARGWFGYSVNDGRTWTEGSEPFILREGKWVGAKVGLFATRGDSPGRRPLELRVHGFLVDAAAPLDTVADAKQ